MYVSMHACMYVCTYNLSEAVRDADSSGALEALECGCAASVFVFAHK